MTLLERWSCTAATKMLPFRAPLLETCCLVHARIRMQHPVGRSTIKQPASCSSILAQPPHHQAANNDATQKSWLQRRRGVLLPEHQRTQAVQKEKLSLDAELLSLDDAPRQSVAEVPRHNRHDPLLRVEVRYFAGTSTEVLGTVEGVDRGEESQELLYRVRFSDGDLIRYTSEQLNGLLADGFAKILELEDTESPSGIKKIRKQ